MRQLWGALWCSDNRLDGRRTWLLRENFVPVIFPTRRAAREWIRDKYGYIAARPDLRAEPHGWRLPKAVRVNVTFALAQGQQNEGAES